MLRWQMAKASESDDSHAVAIALAIQKASEQLRKAILEAKERGMVELIDPNGVVKCVFHAHLGVQCNRCRHRSVIKAKEVERKSRQLEIKCILRFRDLYEGVEQTIGRDRGKVDDRGPCGCHLGPRYCNQIHSSEREKFVSIWQACKDEADIMYDRLWMPFEESLRRTASLPGKTSAPVHVLDSPAPYLAF